MGSFRDNPAGALPEWATRLIIEERLPDTYRHEVQTVVSPVARWIAGRHSEASRPIIVGLNGAQGSGKSTLALFLQCWLTEESGLATACLSLDHLYLGKADRQLLANSEHPLLQTRGVPGTHDVRLGMQLLDRLTDPGASRNTVSMPVFDKAVDDRAPEHGWPIIEAPVDVVLFEGWCVGARPQDPTALETPVNQLEELEDPDGSWRRFVNEQLQVDYAELWRRLDALIMLRIPAFEMVFEWRGLQENKLRQRAGDVSAGQDEAGLERFIRHFERLTRHVLATMGDYADLTIDIDATHRMSVALPDSDL
jgi:D-glycerate 3-kinase